MQFPDDVDGDVLKRLQESGLDFSQPQTVEFIVDFCFWPPDTEAIDILRKKIWLNSDLQARRRL